MFSFIADLTWAHWVLIIVPAAWIGFMAWLAYGPMLARSRAIASSCEWPEVWLEQPVREACHLDDGEELAWQRITRGEGAT